MGKKGRRCKTRWRRLPMGGERPDEAEEEDCCEGSGGDCPGQCTSSAALGGRERAKGGGGGGGGSDGAASPLQNGPKQTTAVSSSSSTAHYAPYKGGVGGQRGGRGSFNGRRNGGGGGGAAVTDGSKKGAGGSGGSVYTFNEDEYTKITTPRQDVLFKKGYLMARKKDTPTASTNGTPSSTETINGEATSNGTSGPQNGDASSSSDQTYSAQVSGSGAEDENGVGNGYAYVNGYTNGYSYGGGYHMDQGGAVPNGGAYFVNGGSYELYDPYAAAAAAAAAAAGYAFPYVGAPPPHPPPPHTLPPLHAIDWYASRPPGSTGNVGDVQWCHLVASPGYSETRRKRYSTDSQNCSPPSSESTGPPGSPQEEAASSSGGDPCHTHQPIPQYHHAHVFQGPHPHAAAYVYPGYLFGPAVYSVNGVPLATPIHPLHGLSQSIHVHPSAAVAAPAPVSGPQGGVPASAAPGSDGGSQRRRKKKRRRKRKRGLTDDASEETSSEVGEEEGVNAAGTCGACSGGGSRGEEFDEEDEEEDGTVVVVRLGNVVPLVMSQPPQSMAVSAPSQTYPQDMGVGREEDEEANEMREGEASSTDCSELSGHPESYSVSGGEDGVLVGENLEDRGTQVEVEDHRRELREEGKSVKIPNGIMKKDAEVSAKGDLVPTENPQPKSIAEDIHSVNDAETKEVSTQSPPEMAVQVNEPSTPPPSPIVPARVTHVPEVSTTSVDKIDDNKTKECSKKVEVGEVPEAVDMKEMPDKGKEKQVSPPKEETPKQKRRNGGRGRNSNNRPAPAIQPIEEPAMEDKTPEMAVHQPAAVEVLVEKPEAPEPVQVLPEVKLETVSTPTLVKATSATTFAEPSSTEVQHTPVVKETERIPDRENSIPIKIPLSQPEPIPVAVEPTPVKAEIKPVHVEPISVMAAPFVPTPVPAPTLPQPPKAEERIVEPPNTLPLDTFTFKPEPYKHPMLKPTRPEKEEEKLNGRAEEAIPEVNGERIKESVPESLEPKSAEKPSPSRLLEDIPRRKSRLKKPPEREQTPGLVPPSSNNDEEGSDEESVPEKVTFAPTLDEDRNVTKETGDIDNKPYDQQPEPQNQPQEEVPQPAGEGSTEERDESLTDVVSKWLDENSDALPDSIEEIKGQEKTEEKEGDETKKDEEENLTGSKNGVGNPFPAPSNNRFSEAKTKRACRGTNEDECVCVSNVRVNEYSRDGPVKRVANRKFEDEEVTNYYNNGEGEDYERRAEDGNSSVEEESCEWEPMTVEPQKRGYSDLETWKRLRGGLGGSSEALRSLGSYRGTDDEDEEEGRKVRLSMCDPTSSVAKYYCLGGRETKSLSPEVEVVPKANPSSSQGPLPTDSGVQSEEEEEGITTGEEAVEDISSNAKTRPHKPVGLGKTAAFVVRQIGTTDSAKGPFPCGICCIIQ